jgi:3-deoxy-D-manno-octulosonate 8-phosphate phosphatase (KDO 8-P phosphatase)
MNGSLLFQPIKVFAFDLDGVLTDGSLVIHPGGEFIRTMDIKDGYALQHAVKKGYRVLVISGSFSQPCLDRLHYLGITDVWMKVKDKRSLLTSYLQENALDSAHVMFMGDDLPDLEVMQSVGLPACPADAVPEIKSISRFISSKTGGKGCVREIIEKVLRVHNNWGIGSTDLSSI